MRSQLVVQGFAEGKSIGLGGSIDGVGGNCLEGKDASDQQKIQVKVGTDGYPADLDVLVEGVTLVGNATGAKIKFLRRIPIDPMTGTTEWGKRSSQDDPKSNSWGGQNVFVVYSRGWNGAPVELPC